MRGIRFSRISNSLRKAAADPHYLLKLKEVEAVAETTEWYLRASLERKESRAGHFRLDYPGRDPQMLAWLVLSSDPEHGIRLQKKPVPIDRYKYPVERYYSDNFRFDPIPTK